MNLESIKVSSGYNQALQNPTGITMHREKAELYWLIDELEKRDDKEADLHNAHYANVSKIESLTKEVEKLRLNDASDDLLKALQQVDSHAGMIKVWEERNRESVAEVESLQSQLAELKTLSSNHEKNRWDNYDLAVKRREEIEDLKARLEASEKKVGG